MAPFESTGSALSVPHAGKAPSGHSFGSASMSSQNAVEAPPVATFGSKTHTDASHIVVRQSGDSGSTDEPPAIVNDNVTQDTSPAMTAASQEESDQYYTFSRLGAGGFGFAIGTALTAAGSSYVIARQSRRSIRDAQDAHNRYLTSLNAANTALTAAQTENSELRLLLEPPRPSNPFESPQDREGTA